MRELKIGVIGGGAAGYFAALRAKSVFPNAAVVIVERSAKTLSKVKISGGGRCNVTHNCFDVKTLTGFYPRGGKFLYKAFHQFQPRDTIQWFEDRGVAMRVYSDNCIFPQSNDSQSIIDVFRNEAARLGIELMSQFKFDIVEKKGEEFILKGDTQNMTFQRLIVAIGGQPKRSGLAWIEALGQPIIEPLPSLFTFNLPNDSITQLMGNVTEATARIEGEKWIGKGPLLVTHWGLSGPAILQLSALGARRLAEKNYEFAVLVNWLNGANEQVTQQLLKEGITTHGQKKLVNFNPTPLTNALWEHLISKSGISNETRWNQLAGKSFNRLVNNLIADRYEVKEKTTFKEEFVTAGGVDLAFVDPTTMESKLVKGLFFAGEVLDIDGLTGGFNFQAAWSTAWVAGTNVGN